MVGPSEAAKETLNGPAAMAQRAESTTLAVVTVHTGPADLRVRAPPRPPRHCPRAFPISRHHPGALHYRLQASYRSTAPPGQPSAQASTTRHRRGNSFRLPHLKPTPSRCRRQRYMGLHSPRSLCCGADELASHPHLPQELVMPSCTPCSATTAK